MQSQRLVESGPELANDDLIATPINLGSSELVPINDLVSKVEKIAGIKLKRHYQR